MLELTDLLERKPAQLSGGQRQRVAMGRAIVREPKAFLMDEPLSNLDAKLRVAMRADIAALQHRLGVTTVYVTHDQVEAMTMGQRVAVLRDGRLQQCGTPRELYDRPRNRFVAGFIGSPAMNLCPAPLFAGGRAELDGVRVELGAEAASAAADGLPRWSSACAPRRWSRRPTGSRPGSRWWRSSVPTPTPCASPSSRRRDAAHRARRPVAGADAGRAPGAAPARRRGPRLPSADR